MKSIPPALALAAALLSACGGGGGGDSFSFSTRAGLTTVIRDAYTYAAAVRNADGPVTWSLLAAPTGMTVDPAGLVEWTPAYDDLGTVTVTLQADDGVHAVEQTWDLRVSQGILMGTGLSWRGHTGTTGQAYVDHLSGHAPWGALISFHMNWRDAGDTDGEIPVLAQVATLGSIGYGFVPGIGIGWADGQGDPDLTSDSAPANDSWTNAETRAEFLAMVTELAQTYQPPYLFVGNETNAYFVTHTQMEWDAWLSEYEACHDAIKAVSPQTLVFTVFQLERLKGLGGGTTGWSNGATWQLVDELETSGKADALGFTTYPYFEYADPSLIPADYFDEIALHWSSPVIFTEIGWKASATFPFPGDEMDQADFIDVFFEGTRDLDLEYVSQLFLHDWDGQASLPPFVDIGLRSNDGTVIRASDAAWRAAVALREL